MLEAVYDGTGVFEAFEAISRVPRGSGYNTKISEFLVAFAKEHGIFVRQDAAENVVMVKEASPGMEDLPTVMLQGHMDMVCEKEADSNHDFLTEGLELCVEDDWIYAEGTTLEADDGIAVAYILALFADETLRHPRLEAVITTDEETGMDGAYALDTSDLKAQYLLNLDSEEEGIFLTSCAGGLTCIGTIPVERLVQSGTLLRIRVHGLKGGHSGEDINKNRTNAVVLLGRLLHELEQELSGSALRLFEAAGGNKDNVIPCEASAEVLVVNGDGKEKPEEIISGLAAVYQKELQAAEPGLCIEVSFEKNAEALALCKESSDRVLGLLYLAPTGVMAMSANMPGLVESSQNLGIFALKEKEAKVHFSIRSSLTSAKYYLEGRCRTLIEMCGGSCERKSEYPAWEYKVESKLREYVSEVYEKMYGKKPVMRAIHAGLECGLILEKMPGLDIVSLGPDIVDIHTAKERMSISSAKRVYALIKELLGNWEQMRNDGLI